MKQSHLLKSRNSWREKAKSGTLEKRKLERKLKNLSIKNAKLENLLREAHTQPQQQSLLPIPSTPSVVYLKIEIRIICLMLFVLGKIPVNAVTRILHFLTSGKLLNFNWVPNPSSIVNWIGRAGIGLLENVGPCNEPWIAIIDASIAFGKAKAMVVLRVPLAVLKNGCAPTLANAQCIAMSIKTTWTGEDVYDLLAQTFQKAGIPAAILKDGGTDLAKGVGLFQSRFPAMAVIQDLGHVIANALKAKYSSKAAFERLLDIANSGRKKLFLSVLSALRPPKIRTKGRFQNISKLLAWAQEMQELMSGQGRAANGTMKGKLRLALKGLCQLRSFVDAFASECAVLNDIQKILKDTGLNQTSYRLALKELDKLPENCSIRAILEKWLSVHLRIQCQMSIGQTPLLVSSDLIESLMGLLKHIIERSPIPEFTTMSLAVPLLCGNQDLEALTAALQSCSHKTLTRWRNENCSHSVRHVRPELLGELKKIEVQKTVQSRAA